MKKVKIYTTQYCAFCVKAKKLLTNKKIIFEEIDLSQYPERMDEMIIKSNGAKTVPQIFLEKPILATVITFTTLIRLVS